MKPLLSNSLREYATILSVLKPMEQGYMVWHINEKFNRRLVL
jgi:hypothetical protein